jgi:hypothetical protein
MSLYEQHTACVHGNFPRACCRICNPLMRAIPNPLLSPEDACEKCKSLQADNERLRGENAGLAGELQAYQILVRAAGRIYREASDESS